MARAMSLLSVVAVAANVAHVESSHARSWAQTLGGVGGQASDTPVARVVRVLKEMSKTLQSEMEEDEKLFDKLKCWCDSSSYDKETTLSASESKIQELGSTVEALTAKSAELAASVKELNSGVDEDKRALAEATSLHEKESAEAHSEATDYIQAIESLKAAIVVLSKHHKAPPASSVAGGAIFKSEQDQWSFLSTRKRGGEPEDRFLQADRENLWGANDEAVLKRALEVASAFVQHKGGHGYVPAYTSQSGEILGVLTELKNEMESNLNESQRLALERSSIFNELKAAKSAEIEHGERLAEQKEDQLATTDNELAEAKEDLGQEKAALDENQKFLTNLRETCSTADTNFAKRKASRIAEIEAVSQTIAILQADESRDQISRTYNFLEISARKSVSTDRVRAAALLRSTARRVHNPELSVLATATELDSFERVKRAIDDMTAMLKVQLEDEVKKRDWCKSEFHGNDMATARSNDLKTGLQAKIEELEGAIKTIAGGITDLNGQIVQLQLDLQRASEDRKFENFEFQKTVEDQTGVVEVLKKALDKLRSYYSQQNFLETTKARQTPPVPQAEYKPSKAAPGVMEMIEKLISEAKELVAESKHSEQQVQAAYESVVYDTFASLQGLQEQVVAKTASKAEATKAKQQATDDLYAVVNELEGMSRYNGELHGECDYLLKNFDIRQQARSEEIEALQQAKQILSGALATD